MEFPGGALHPDLNREMDATRRAIVFLHFNGDGHRQLFLILDGDRRAFRRVTRHIFDTRYGLVDLPVIEYPSTPEPIQRFAGSIFDGMKKVIRGGMFEGPFMDIIPEGIIETV